jgi:hypothetical protein
LSATLIGVQLFPPRAEQGRAVPSVAVAHVADDRSVTFSVPSPAFVISTERVGPFCPAAIETGPMVVSESRSAGAARITVAAMPLRSKLRISFIYGYPLTLNNSSTFCFWEPEQTSPAARSFLVVEGSAGAEGGNHFPYGVNDLGAE